MKRKNFVAIVFISVLISISLLSCSDYDENLKNKEYDGTLFGEWIENSGNSYVFDYYCFYSDGTGIHGSWESDIDWVNEEDDIEWYTIDNKYLYINGSKYEYFCTGTSLEIKMNGKIRCYYEK